jgi:hypothetical protein
LLRDKEIEAAFEVKAKPLHPPSSQSDRKSVGVQKSKLDESGKTTPITSVNDTYGIRPFIQTSESFQQESLDFNRIVV